MPSNLSLLLSGDLHLDGGPDLKGLPSRESRLRVRTQPFRSPVSRRRCKNVIHHASECPVTSLILFGRGITLVVNHQRASSYARRPICRSLLNTRSIHSDVEVILRGDRPGGGVDSPERHRVHVRRRPHGRIAARTSTRTSATCRA